MLLKDVFNAFARKHGPRPRPIKIDPTWFAVPETVPEPPDLPEPDEFDEQAFADDYPDWDEEPLEPVDDTITLKPDERVPVDAGALLRTYYAPGIGDMRVYSRLSPDEMDIDPEQIVEHDDLELDRPEPEKKPKSPK